MLAALRDRVQRSLLPRAVIAASRVRAPRRMAARLTRACGGRIGIELYFAFDDPYAAIALPGLLRLIEGRPLQLHLYPLLQRGIPQDPAAAARRHHAVMDADRVAGREGQRLRRQAPLDPTDCAFLAAWTEAARGHAAQAAFAAAALQLLWRDSSGAVPRQACLDLHRKHLGGEPPADTEACQDRLAGNTRRLHARGHWESPAARVAGEWFFAHERLAQIAALLDQLEGATP
jgi:2-hydroxychromene-2-carboxylate isomerase